MGFNDFNTLSITEHHFSFIDINEDIYLSVFTCLFYTQIQFSLKQAWNSINEFDLIFSKPVFKFEFVNILCIAGIKTFLSRFKKHWGIS